MTDYVLTADFFDQIVERRPDRSPQRIVKHRRGDTVTGLTEAEAERLIHAGAIRPLAEKSAAQPDTAPDDSGVTGSPTDETPAPDASESPSRPLKTAAVAEWREFAESNGMPTDEAAKLTRAELISRYGGN